MIVCSKKDLFTSVLLLLFQYINWLHSSSQTTNYNASCFLLYSNRIEIAKCLKLYPRSNESMLIENLRKKIHHENRAPDLDCGYLSRNTMLSDTV